MLTRDRLGAFIAVLFGTAVVTLTLTLLASAAHRVPGRYAAVTLAVQSPGVTTAADPFPETQPWSTAEADAVAARLAGAPGVQLAVADHQFYAQPVLGGRPSTDIQEGHGWSSAALARDQLITGRPARSDREMVLANSLGIPVGGTVTILTGTGPSQWTVTGLIATRRLYVSDAAAVRLAPGVRMIGLTGDPDPALIRTLAGGATVLHGAALGGLEPRADARTRWIGMQVLSAMAALAAFSCAFVIASTFALAVNQRRREIGLLRAIGATPRQIRRSVLREAAVAGALAALAGTLVGVVAAPVIGVVLVSAGFEPASFTAGLHLWPVLAGSTSGPAVSVAGALVAARRASRVSPLDALRRAEVETRPMTRARWTAGLLAAAGGVVAGIATVATADLTDLGTYALLGAMALVLAATLLAPAAVPPLVRLLLRPMRGALGTVMRESALAGARRTASTASPVLLTVAFAMFIAGNVQTSANAYADRRAEAIRSGTVLIPDGTPGLTDAAAPSAPLTTTVYLDGTAVTAAGLDSSTMTGIGAASALTAPGTAMLNEAGAAQLGRGRDDILDVTFADGIQVPLRITGVAADSELPAELVLGRATVRAHDPSALAAALPVTPGSPAQASPGARIVGVGTYAKQADADEDRLVWIFTLLLIGVSVGYGALAVANTLFMATTRRAPDYHLLRLAGATRRQILLTVAGESAVVVAIGAVLGGGAALFALWGTTAGLRAQIGPAVTPVVPWPTAAVAVIACLLLALAGSVLPARAQLTTAGPRRQPK
jgi:putative ABC transport system permease protein